MDIYDFCFLGGFVLGICIGIGSIAIVYIGGRGDRLR